MFKKILASFLAVAMLASVGATVMAKDNTNTEPTMVEVASYDEDLGDGTVLRKNLMADN